MRDGSYARLDDRGVVRIGGAECAPFLQNIVTTDIDRVVASGSGFGALLSPQGKILVDFLIYRHEDGFLFDLPLAQTGDFVKRMTLYRLRAKVEIENRSERDAVAAYWDADHAPVVDGVVAADPRLAELGFRAIVPKDADPGASGAMASDAAGYHAWRIAHAIPEGGIDFPFGEAFPHDVDMDDLGGLDFRKGCYVGQEIVSRMEHRGTARRRAVAVSGGADLPEPGTAIEAGDRLVGTLGSSAGSEGIALVRLDRTKRALDDGATLTAGGVTLSVRLPAFARFGWPQAGDEDGAA